MNVDPLARYEIRGLISPHWDGHCVTSSYADLFWLPRLGPSALSVLRWIHHQPDCRAQRTLAELAASLGIGGGERNTRNLERAIRRLSEHHLALWTNDRIELALTVPPLPARIIAELDAPTRALHEATHSAPST